jgi:hypothetical protein
MAELDQTTVANINLHLKAIYAEGELSEAATIKSYLIVRSEGGRTVRRQVKLGSHPGRGLPGARIARPQVRRCSGTLGSVPYL